MEFRILGPLEVLDEDRIVPLPRGRGRALLALLALRAGEVLSTDRLIDELWGDAPPPTAITALQGLVSNLRRRLDPDRGDRSAASSVLRTHPPGYVLAVDRTQVDAQRFQDLVEAASGAPAPVRGAHLRAALSLWRGPPLADFAYAPFAQSAITFLEELRTRAIEQRVEADLEQGRHAALIGELTQLVAEYPLRERLRAQLMLALYRTGRQAEALEVYREARHALVEELGIEPGAVLHDLEQAILRQDPALDAPVDVVAEAGSVDSVRSWLAAGRKMVTVVFADLGVSGDSAAESDPEAVRRVAERSFDSARAVLERHGGAVTAFIGDVVVAVFGLPLAHEDDALRAVRAAEELRHRLAATNRGPARDRVVKLSARIGVNTGNVVVGGPGAIGTAASGAAVTVAARLQQEAADGEVLVGEATRDLVGDAAVFEPVAVGNGGGSRPVAAWRLLDVRPAGVVPTRPDSPMVGRVAELMRLRELFGRAVEQQRSLLVTVVGEPGVGKSRLAAEFTATLRGKARVLGGRCPAYGDGITFWPLREVVLQAVGDRGVDGVADLLTDNAHAQPVAAQVSGAIGLTEFASSPAELFPAIRLLLEAVATDEPLVVVFEDVHWAQPTLLDLLQYLAGSIRRAVLLLCLARPELLDARTAWASDHTTPIFLGPLSRGDSEKLVTDRHPAAQPPPETMTRLLELGGGNPLYLEQMLAAWRDVRELTIPPTMQALLAARLDQLGPAERDLLRCAAVAGTEFSADALTALVPPAARRYVGRYLGVLEQKELIRAIPRPVLDRPAFEFRHALIQLAAYRSMTRADRSTLHERFARWLERETADRALEFEELIGYHLEQASDQRRRIGLVDDTSRDLAERAGERLACAGLRAYRRFDIAAAENLLSRAKKILPAGHPQLSTAMSRLPELYQMLGRHQDADAILAELADSVDDAGSKHAQDIRLERARIRLIIGPDPVKLDDIRGEADRALAEYRSSGDDAGTASALFVRGLVHLRRGEPREMEIVSRRSLVHAERSAHPRDILAARWWVALALVEGPTPVRECISHCAELARLPGTEHPGVLSELARLRAMLSDFAVARDLIARARHLVLERMRLRRPLMFLAGRSAEVEFLACDFHACTRELRTALGLARELGERDFIAQFAAYLSSVSSAHRNTADATQFASTAAEAAPAESVSAQALWRAAKARVLSHQGDQRGAQQLTRDAIRLVPHDMLNLRADLHVTLAESLFTTGLNDAGARVLNEAIEMYARKGNINAAERARSVGATRRRRA